LYLRSTTPPEIFVDRAHRVANNWTCCLIRTDALILLSDGAFCFGIRSDNTSIDFHLFADETRFWVREVDFTIRVSFPRNCIFPNGAFCLDFGSVDVAVGSRLFMDEACFTCCARAAKIHA